MPGKIISAMISAKSANPLMLLDEIDKLAGDFRGDPAAALLEALDPEQNSTFNDHFIDMPFDLSHVLFITTANDLGAIPGPLRDRMDVIELPSYTRVEKYNIARKHLVPKQLDACGLTGKVTFSQSALYGIIDGYTREAGVRNLERTITSVLRKCARKIASGEAENVMYAVKAVQGLLTLAGRKESITEQNVRYIINLVRAGNEAHIDDIARDVLCVTAKGKPIKAKTIGQKRYVEAIRKNTVTLGIGPAGTGKTYLAVAAAVAAFRDKQVNRIILTRPAVEAGERLGFLPGDLQSKVDPYLRPLYDALFDMLGAETYNKYLERGSIEVAPLAYMRGRTLDDSFIILDEAQNTSREQMKMFLTRLGFGSKIVITGDITQIDLPRDTVSGLKEAMRVLNGVEDIAICRLGEADVVRHVIVQRIIRAYEEDENRKKVHK